MSHAGSAVLRLIADNSWLTGAISTALRRRVFTPVQGRSPASLLHTYNQERRGIAEDLIATDKRWSKAIGAAQLDPSNPEAALIGLARCSGSSSPTSTSPRGWRPTTTPARSSVTPPTWAWPQVTNPAAGSTPQR